MEFPFKDRISRIMRSATTGSFLLQAGRNFETASGAGACEINPDGFRLFVKLPSY